VSATSFQASGENKSKAEEVDGNVSAAVGKTNDSAKPKVVAEAQVTDCLAHVSCEAQSR